MCKQISPFYVKAVLASNGERLPVLINRDTGIPVFDAVLWVVSSLRNKGHASETITQALRSIALLYTTLNHEGVDLTNRLKNGEFLYPAEIGLIVTACKSTLASHSTISKNSPIETSKQRITSLESVRMNMIQAKFSSRVEPGTTKIRLGYIREFLIWKINQEILQASKSMRPNIIALRDLVDQEIRNKTPSARGKNRIHQRIGLSKDDQKFLLEIIDPSNQLNPWGTVHTKKRNQLIIYGLLELGIRRGEFLGLRLRDISSQGQEIKILRRPDDKDDPRLYEPNTKTCDRLLPLSESLNRLIREYIFLRHEIVKGKHDFLLVASGTGRPLSKSEFNRLCHPIQTSCESLQDLTPHVLRHTFCENICEELDRNGADPDTMESILRQLGGWSENSSSPQTYTKRYAQRKADVAIRSMQKNLRINSNE